MMRRREEMQVNVAGLRRNIKNIAHNYSDAQIKVREATCNDPWGPSSTLMSEIADLTYNVVAFTEIMQMIWKRLNDHGRNWRHVYKALVLLEYLIKTGSEKVGQQCKENIFAIQTLRDFQYLDEGKDQGINVREKAKQLVLLLRDDERLKNERARALKAKERFSQTGAGFGSDTTLDTTSPSSPSFNSSRTWGAGEVEPTSKVDIMCARPSTAGEEELQLQLALAMSREEAEQEEQKRKSDDVRLQLAISQSQNEFKQHREEKPRQSHMLDLLDVNLSPHEVTSASAPPPLVDPWGVPIPPPRPQNDPWSTSLPSAGNSVSPDPWSPVSGHPPPKPAAVVAQNDPWKVSAASVSPPPIRQNDPWSPATIHSPASLSSPSNNDLDEFDVITNRDRYNINNNQTGGTTSPNPFNMSALGDSLNDASTTNSKRRSPHSFLGENSALVNLDNLVTKPVLPPAVNQPPQVARNVAAANPFSPLAPLQPMRSSYSSASSSQPLTSSPNPFLS